VSKGREIAYFSDGLGLVGLFCVVGSDTFSLELLGFSILLLVLPKEIEIVITSLLFLRSRSMFGSSLTGEDGAGTAGTREG
jgi:hypothetical protein